MYVSRMAEKEDMPAVAAIYNQGIEDRAATLETRLRTVEEMEEWFTGRGERYKVIVAADEDGIVHGWASLNVFNSRCCYSGVADISVYVEREWRGKGFGRVLLGYLEQAAVDAGFKKLVLSTFDFNEAGKRLYRSAGFREVGTYMEQGILDGRPVNVTIMEKLLKM